MAMTALQQMEVAQAKQIKKRENALRAEGMRIAARRVYKFCGNGTLRDDILDAADRMEKNGP